MTYLAAGGEPLRYRVLFLCTGNSARSVLAESLLNKWGHGYIRAYSAGSHPRGVVHPRAIAELRDAGIPAEGYRSKSWDEFTEPGAPRMDVVVTVCDQAAGEACPLWPGAPLQIHWSIPDPAAPEIPEPRRAEAFHRAYVTLDGRIRRMAELMLNASTPEALKGELDMLHEDHASAS